jgi:SPFH domain / Band 7 family
MSPFRKKEVSWARDPSIPSELVWRLPNDKYPKISRVNAIVVKEFEKAIFYKGGTMESIRSSGKHPVPKGINEIIWVDISPKQETFGIPKNHGPTTKDGHQLGLSGALTLRVNGDMEKNVAQFISRVVAANTSFTREQLVDWLREGPLVSVFRDIAKNFTYKEFIQIDREELISQQVRPRLFNELYRLGLDLISIDLTGVTEPTKLP